MTLDRDLVAAALPAYELGEELGRGGWGVVIGGRHRELRRDVAIKQLPRAFAADPAVRARFVAEARLLAGFDHPHIVPVYDFVDSGGLCLLVMEKLPGGTVWSRFSAHGVTMETACAITLASCAALKCAHGQGVLHRDIKPENLLFSGGEVLKVTDFGIAKVVGGGQTLSTRAGEVLGTPAYMAPEQAQAKPLSPATDIYATGTMLYELLSGRLPFPDEGDALAVVFRHVYEQPAPLREVAPHVPQEICEVVMRAIATDPADRYASAEAFGVALAEAATSAWSPGWLGQGQVPVMAASEMVAVTERASGPLDRRPAPATVAEPASALQKEGDTPVAPGGRAPETLAQDPLPVPPVRRAAETHAEAPAPGAAPPTPPSPPAAAPMRPTTATRRRGGRLDDIDASDLVPVSEVLPRPPSSAPLTLAALVLALAAVALAFMGLGRPDYDPGPSGSLTLNGVAVGESPVEIDLAEPVVLVSTEAGGSSADITVLLKLSVAGIPLARASTTVAAGPDGSFTAALEAPNARYLVAGRATATVEVRDSTGAALSQRTFPVSSAQAPVLTGPGIGGIALVLFVIAYAESLLRSRRRGKKQFTAPVGMVVIGALGGVAAVVAASVLADREAVVPTVIACASLGVAAGLTAVAAAARSARRRRTRHRRRT